MNILFLTLDNILSISNYGIYEDLLREFQRNGNKIYVVSPAERRYRKNTHIIEEGQCKILKVKTGNIQKTNIIEKGISTVMIEPAFKKAIKEYFSDVKFDLVLYSTPPITLVSAIDYVKKRDNAKTYLMLKDIFPQNAVDIGMMTTTGVKGLLYKHFRKQEKKLYAISDRIGCMSQANVDYVIKHNPEIDPKIVVICPNCIEPVDMRVSSEVRDEMRKKYGLPLDKKIFVYGGNLGKPQGIPFIVDCLKSQKDNDEAFFLIVGDGTEYGKLEAYVNEANQSNLKLMKRLPKEDYDRLVAACDVGLIFLDYRFTIPNFPSRLLSYMQAGLPVLAATDPNTDIGKVITKGGFGWWCESNEPIVFANTINTILESDMLIIAETEYQYLERNFSVRRAYEIIMKNI